MIDMRMDVDVLVLMMNDNLRLVNLAAANEHLRIQCSSAAWEPLL